MPFISHRDMNTCEVEKGWDYNTFPFKDIMK